MYPKRGRLEYRKLDFEEFRDWDENRYNEAEEDDAVVDDTRVDGIDYHLDGFDGGDYDCRVNNNTFYQ